MGEEQETIKAAAILFKDKIYRGDAHAEIFEKIRLEYPHLTFGTGDDGFVTSIDRFVSRGEAMQIARARGQLKHDDGQVELYSQNVIYR